MATFPATASDALDDEVEALLDVSEVPRDRMNRHNQLPAEACAKVPLGRRLASSQPHALHRQRLLRGGLLVRRQEQRDQGASPARRREGWDGIPQMRECSELLQTDHIGGRRLCIVPAFARPVGKPTSPSSQR